MMEIPERSLKLFVWHIRIGFEISASIAQFFDILALYIVKFLTALFFIVQLSNSHKSVLYIS